MGNDFFNLTRHTLVSTRMAWLPGIVTYLFSSDDLQRYPMKLCSYEDWVLDYIQDPDQS